LSQKQAFSKKKSSQRFFVPKMAQDKIQVPGGAKVAQGGAKISPGGQLPPLLPAPMFSTEI